jgi:(2Fe-2S) ferredoxin
MATWVKQSQCSGRLMVNCVLYYDPEADAIYIRLRDGKVDHTIESSKYIYVDVDVNNVPLGAGDSFRGASVGRT